VTALAFMAGVVLGGAGFAGIDVAITVVRRRRQVKLAKQIAADLRAVFEKLVASAPVHPTCPCAGCVARRRAVAEETRN
jgi:hypothetical protein